MMLERGTPQPMPCESCPGRIAEFEANDVRDAKTLMQLTQPSIRSPTPRPKNWPKDTMWPAGERVLVYLDPITETETAGGILIPGNVRRGRGCTATVVACGGRVRDHSLWPGQRVIIDPYKIEITEGPGGREATGSVYAKPGDYAIGLEDEMVVAVIDDEKVEVSPRRK